MRGFLANADSTFPLLAPYSFISGMPCRKLILIHLEPYAMRDAELLAIMRSAALWPAFIMQPGRG